MNVVLLDMDGTLTPHRQVMNLDMLRMLIRLLKVAQVGIISGSKFDDICKQCRPLWDTIGTVHLENLTLFPCNGTQSFFWVDGSGWCAEYKNEMAPKLSIDSFQKLLREIMFAQTITINNSNQLSDFEITHDFIDYRGSLINWCPIGRSSTMQQRLKFVDLDRKNNIRDQMISTLRALLLRRGFEIEKITIAKGGQTSLDIFPKGWDKTFVMKRFDQKKATCWFVGDACEEGQNDYELYNLLSYENRSFKTKSPKQTLEIIDNIISAIENGDRK